MTKRRVRRYRVHLRREAVVELSATSQEEAAETALARAAAGALGLRTSWETVDVVEFSPAPPRRPGLPPEACPGSYSRPVSVGSGGFGAGKCGTCGQHANLLKDGALTRHKRREVK